jgi:hypothetical protein
LRHLHKFLLDKSDSRYKRTRFGAILAAWCIAGYASSVQIIYEQ